MKYCKDRSSRGGGVLIAIKDNLASSLITSPSDIETITIKIPISNPIIICLVYIPPNYCNSDSYYDSLFHHLSDLSNGTSKIIVVGDFNFPDIDWATYSGSSPTSNKFSDLLFQFNFSQLINELTHNQGNIFRSRYHQ